MTDGWFLLSPDMAEERFLSFKFNGWFHPVYILHQEAVVVLHILFFLAALNCFANGVFQFYAFPVGSRKQGDELLSPLESHLDLAAYGLLELSERLEWLVETGRGDGNGVIFLLPVKAFLETVADFHAVLEVHTTFFGVDYNLHIIVLAESTFNHIQSERND